MRSHNSGRTAERAIADLLRQLGCRFDAQAIVGYSIYDRKIRADFLIRNLADYPHGLAIECKRQDRDGTVDQKFPFVIWNIRGPFEKPTQGYRHPLVIVEFCDLGCPSAIAWLRRQVDGSDLVGVFSYVEFLRWLERLPLSPSTL